jgi:hypothetical protein
MQPLWKTQRVYQILAGFYSLGTFICVVVISAGNSQSTFVLTFITLGLAIFTVFMLVLLICLVRKALTVFDNIDEICAERSTESPLVDYHLRRNTNSCGTYCNPYIEVSISDQEPVNYDNNSNDVVPAAAIPVTITAEFYT